MRELVTRDPNLVRGQSIKHKSIIGVGTVGNIDLLYGCLCGFHDAKFLYGF
jgi:hypothetical protein